MKTMNKITAKRLLQKIEELQALYDQQLLEAIDLNDEKAIRRKKAYCEKLDGIIYGICYALTMQGFGNNYFVVRKEDIIKDLQSIANA